MDLMTDQELRMYCVEQVAKWGQTGSYNPTGTVVCNRSLANEADGIYNFIKSQNGFEAENPSRDKDE